MAQKKIKYRLGCSGYYYSGWKGLFYPEGLAKSKWLWHYTKHFNTVEINSTFYKFPRASAMKQWHLKSPDNFFMSVKANRAITHMKKFRGTKSLVKRFYKACDALKEKLGCVLFQLHPNLQYHEEKLNEILEQMDNSYKNVLEFRHKSWFCRDVYSALRKAGAGFCCVSGPGLPDDCLTTSKVFYVRFHGKTRWYDYNYSKKELQEWAGKIRKASKKAKEVYAYFNNDHHAYAPRNCKELEKYLKLKKK